MQIPLDSAKPSPWGQNFKVRFSRKERGLKKACVWGCLLLMCQRATAFEWDTAWCWMKCDTKCSYPFEACIIKFDLSLCLLKPNKKEKKENSQVRDDLSQQGTFSTRQDRRGCDGDVIVGSVKDRAITLQRNRFVFDRQWKRERAAEDNREFSSREYYRPYTNCLSTPWADGL